MARGYWIARVHVHNPDGYKLYTDENGLVFKKYGGRFLVRAGQFQPKEGGNHRSRNIVIEFPDYAAALACFESPEYQRLIAVRAPHGTADIIVIEGYDGAQP
jgi:uncharacterized protein (DUF1330 family)